MYMVKRWKQSDPRKEGWGNAHPIPRKNDGRYAWMRKPPGSYTKTQERLSTKMPHPKIFQQVRWGPGRPITWEILMLNSLRPPPTGLKAKTRMWHPMGNSATQLQSNGCILKRTSCTAHPPPQRATAYRSKPHKKAYQVLILYLYISISISRVT